MYNTKPTKMNNYILHIKGEEVKAQGVNLEQALDRKGIIFTKLFHEDRRKPNGRYNVQLGSQVFTAVWLEKFKDKKNTH